MPLNNFGVVLPGRLYRCEQPGRRGFSDLAVLGVNTIVKLNTDREYPLALEKGQFPGSVFPFALPMTPSPEQLQRMAGELNELLNQKRIIAVHCLDGRDRTGALIGAWRLLHDGWSRDAMTDERKIFGAGELLNRTFDRMIVGALEGLVDA